MPCYGLFLRNILYTNLYWILPVCTTLFGYKKVVPLLIMTSQWVVTLLGMSIVSPL